MADRKSARATTRASGSKTCKPDHQLFGAPRRGTVPGREWMASGGFMVEIRSGNFQFGLMLATALAVSVWPAAGRPSTAQLPQTRHTHAFPLVPPPLPTPP